MWTNEVRSAMVIHLARMPQSFLDKANVPAITHTLSTQIDLVRTTEHVRSKGQICCVIVELVMRVGLTRMFCVADQQRD